MYVVSGGFQFLLILDLWGISFHAVVVFGLGKKLLFKSMLGRCLFENPATSGTRYDTFDDLDCM